VIVAASSAVLVPVTRYAPASSSSKTANPH
jgi:hypothetical protein